MSSVSIIAVPYDAGQRGVRMGAGPEALLHAGLREALEDDGYDVDVQVLEAPGAWRAEIVTTFALAAAVADRARHARAHGQFPLLVTGNCMMTLGIIAALRAPASIVWLDAHGDFNTPETTIGGFIDGMALATMTGRCWTQMASAIAGFEPVEERHVVLAGARDLDPLEAEALNSSFITRVASQSIAAELEAAAASRSSGAAEVHLHVDLDVLDPSEGRVNVFSAPGGVTRIDLLAALEGTARRVPVVSATMSAYDPKFDDEGRVARIAIEVARAIFRGVSQQEGSRRQAATSRGA